MASKIVPDLVTYRYCDKVLTVQQESSEANNPADTFLQDIIQTLHVESTRHDLMLIATTRGTEHCVYHPATRHRRIITPLSPLHDWSGFRALAVRPHSNHDFRILHIVRPDSTGEYKSVIFSSETGEWSEPAADTPALPWTSDVVAAADGTLFWVEDFHCRMAVLFDPFAGYFRRLALPDDLVTQSEFHELAPPGELPVYGFDKYRMCVGAVRGRVRFSQLCRVPQSKTFNLRVWELEDGRVWRLVHEVRVRPGADTKWMYMLALDPGDGDVIFLCRDSDVYRFCVSKHEYRWVFRLSCRMVGLSDISEDVLPRYARVYIITPPVWPAALPPTFESADEDIYVF